MKIFKFLFVCTILFSCSKPKIGEIGNYQVALGDVKADFYVLMWEQSFNLKKSKVYTSYSNGALHSTRGVLSGKVLHGDYKEFTCSHVAERRRPRRPAPCKRPQGHLLGPRQEIQVRC